MGPRSVSTFVLLLAIALSAKATPSPQQQRLAAAAEAQVGVTRTYDSSYTSLRYPGGDVPVDRGVCADVIVRAFRKIGVDLQVAVHVDMAASFGEYPKRWGLRKPDSNIDHRRVANLMKFFERKGKSISRRASYEPGDVVAWRLSNGLLHIGMVSTVPTANGVDSLMVHNIGDGAKTEDVLHAFEIIGHYRW